MLPTNENETENDRPTQPIIETLPPPVPSRPKGFAAMPKEYVKAIASKGGMAAHQAGKAHEFTSEEAREAGRKGGTASHAKRRAKEQARKDTE